MTQFISTVLIEPVIRQARRLSRPSGSLGSDAFGEQPVGTPLPRNPNPSTLYLDALEASPTDEHSYEAPTHESRRRRGSSARERTRETDDSASGGESGETTDGVARERSAQTQSQDISLRVLASRSRAGTGTDSRVQIIPSPPSSPRPSIGRRVLFRGTGTSTATSINEAEWSSTELSGQLRQSVDEDRMAQRNLGPYREAGDGALPEDDGMGLMRKRILDVQSMDCSNAEKSRLIHTIMTEEYSSSLPHLQSPSGIRPRSPASLMSQDRPFTPISSASVNGTSRNASPLTSRSSVNDELYLSASDRKPSYWVAPANRPSAPATASATPSESGKTEEERPERPLGCRHYKRNVKLQCSTCLRWYTCRFCHDEVEDHPLIRRETKNMLCVLCGCAQPAAEECRDCCERGAWYYCDICKLWDNDTEKSIYHCDDCGICRVGQGLGKDFYHCKTCLACLSISIRDTHRCIERSTDCDCPICGEYMFTSPQTVVFMRCGHSIHHTCYKEHMRNSFKCPICSRSIINMEMTFRHLDRAIESQPMPSQFQDTKAFVYCNDCCAKSSVKYHWLGLKCAVCDSYNTAQLRMQSESSRQLSSVAAGGNEATLPAEPDAASAAALLAVTRGRSLLANAHVRRTATSASAVQNLRLPALEARISQVMRSSSENNTRYCFPRDDLSVGSSSDDEMDTRSDLIDFWGGDGPEQSSMRRGPDKNGRAAATTQQEDESGESEEEEEEEDDEDEDDMAEDDDYDSDDSEEDPMEILGHP